MINNRHYVAFIFAVTLAFSSVTLAQTRIGTLQGTVRDPQGAVVSGAIVRISQPLTGYVQTT